MGCYTEMVRDDVVSQMSCEGKSWLSTGGGSKIAKCKERCLLSPGPGRRWLSRVGEEGVLAGIR